MAWLTPRPFSPSLGSPWPEARLCATATAVAHARPEVCVYQWEGLEGKGSGGHTGDSEVISPSAEELYGIVKKNKAFIKNYKPLLKPLLKKETWIQVLASLLISCRILGKSHHYSEPSFPHL